MHYLHPILWRKERGAPKKLPTSCSVHTESNTSYSFALNGVSAPAYAWAFSLGSLAQTCARQLGLYKLLF